MKINISTHAQIRMMSRNIDLDKVKKVINAPDKVTQQFEGRAKAEKEIDGKIYTVIYKKRRQIFDIITTYA